MRSSERYANGMGREVWARWSSGSGLGRRRLPWLQRGSIACAWRRALTHTPSLPLDEVFGRELAFQGPPDGSEIPGPLLSGRYSPLPTVIKGLLSPPRVVARRLILPDIYHSSSSPPPPTVSLWFLPHQILPDPLYLQYPSLKIVASGEGHTKPT